MSLRTQAENPEAPSPFPPALPFDPYRHEGRALLIAQKVYAWLYRGWCRLF